MMEKIRESLFLRLIMIAIFIMGAIMTMIPGLEIMSTHLLGIGAFFGMLYFASHLLAHGQEKSSLSIKEYRKREEKRKEDRQQKKEEKQRQRQQMKQMKQEFISQNTDSIHLALIYLALIYNVLDFESSLLVIQAKFLAIFFYIIIFSLSLFIRQREINRVRKEIKSL